MSRFYNFFDEPNALSNFLVVGILLITTPLDNLSGMR